MGFSETDHTDNVIDIFLPDQVYAGCCLKNRWVLQGTDSPVVQFLLENIRVNDELEISYADAERRFVVYHQGTEIGWIPKTANRRYRDYYLTARTLIFVKEIFFNRQGRRGIEIGVCVPGT